VTCSVIQVSEPVAAEHPVIAAICNLRWQDLRNDELLMVATAYHYFSIQFRENLEIARALRPDDLGLADLYEEECDTDNLSPWPGVADAGERLNHDEFMRRLLALEPIADAQRLEAAGAAYLATVRAIDPAIRAQSIISYEDGGLSNTFQAMLRAPSWEGVSAQAFKFFLQRHIQFDKNETAGHGLMVRHLKESCDVTPLWTAFLEILTISAPRLFAQAPERQQTEPEHRTPFVDGVASPSEWAPAMA
jgi:hypothetical protein